MVEIIDPAEIEAFMAVKFDVSAEELVAMAKAAPDMGGKILEELNEFVQSAYGEEVA